MSTTFHGPVNSNAVPGFFTASKQRAGLCSGAADWVIGHRRNGLIVAQKGPNGGLSDGYVGAVHADSTSCHASRAFAEAYLQST